MTASANELPCNSKFLRITDIQNDKVDWSKVPFVEASESDKKKYGLQSGDIVFARTGATTGKSFLIRECPEEAVFASYLIRVRVNSEKVDPAYLSAFFKTPIYWNQIKKNSGGSAQAGVNSTKLKTIEVPLPQLYEQKRIAAILDKADALREKRRQAIAKLDELLQSVFQDMFGDPANTMTIEQMINDRYILLHKDGNHGSLYPRENEFGQTGIPFLSAKSVSDSGELITSNIQFLSIEKALKLRIGWIEKGDVLLAHNASVGKVCLYDGRYQKALIGTSLTAFRPNPKYLTSEYLYCALRNITFQKQLKKDMGQTTRNQVPISAQRELCLPVPNYEDQLKFQPIYSKQLELRDSLSPNSAKLDKLLNSLQHRAFKGEL